MGFESPAANMIIGTVLESLGSVSVCASNGCPSKPGAQGTAVLPGPEDSGVLKSAERLGSEADE